MAALGLPRPPFALPPFLLPDLRSLGAAAAPAAAAAAAEALGAEELEEGAAAAGDWWRALFRDDVSALVPDAWAGCSRSLAEIAKCGAGVA